VEVKQEGDLGAHIEQAKKEAFAMWCHNALQQSYGPVRVVLTDLTKVCGLAWLGWHHGLVAYVAAQTSRYMVVGIQGLQLLLIT
jgi:hypothetical protein